MITLRTPYLRAQSGSDASGPSTATSRSIRPRLVGSSSTRPTTRHFGLRASSRVSRAPASPAPTTSTGSPSAANGL